MASPSISRTTTATVTTTTATTLTDCNRISLVRKVGRSDCASRRNRRYWAVLVAATCALALGGGAVSASPAPAPRHHLTKRSFFDIQCKGVYDKSIFARLDRICEDCYNLFREPQLHSLCRKNCFTTEYFKGCLEALQLTDEMEQIQTWIKQLHGAEPGV